MSLPNEIKEKVNALFIKGFEIPAEKLTPAASLYEDLGLDSLDAVDMLVHLEEAFKIKVDGERLMEVRTLQNVYDLVAEVARDAREEVASASDVPSGLTSNIEMEIRGDVGAAVSVV